MSASPAPRVTVLMAVHNGAAYLAPAIESILAQTWRDFEFLILDDASTDATGQILAAVSDPRVRVLRNERNLGLTASLNRGLREARGGLIARQDADDLSAPERLALQVAFLDAHPPAALVGAQGWSVGAGGRKEGRLDTPLEPASIRWALPFLNPLVHSVVTFRRAMIWDALGGYDEAFSCCQDYELWARVAGRYELHNLPQRLIQRRVHRESISSTKRAEAGRLVLQVVERLLHGKGLTSEEVALVARMRAGLKPAEARAMRTLVERLHPGDPGQGDLRRTVAWVHAYLGYSLLPRSAAGGLAELWRAARLDPAYGLTLPWAKICALALLGDKARRLVEALRGA